MAVWVVRAGRKGEQEQDALKLRCAVIDWPELGDLARFQTWEKLRDEMDRAYRGKQPHKGTRTKWTSEVWNFARKINIGDLLVLPLKKGIPSGRIRRDGVIAVGEFVGEYEHVGAGKPGTEHRRKVRWVRRDIRRIDCDIPDNLEKRQTVFPLESPQSEERIRALTKGR